MDTSQSPLAELVRASKLPAPAECKRIRKAARVSLQRVADEVGVAETTVYRWEEGEWTPLLENARKYRTLLDSLAEVAGTEIDWAA